MGKYTRIKRRLREKNELGGTFLAPEMEAKAQDEKKKRSISEVALVLGRLVLGYLTPPIVSLSVYSTLPLPTPLGQIY